MQELPSLQQIIETLPEQLAKTIMETSDIPLLKALQQIHQNNPDIVAVIEARIENINYLVV